MITESNNEYPQHMFYGEFEKIIQELFSFYYSESSVKYWLMKQANMQS